MLQEKLLLDDPESTENRGDSVGTKERAGEAPVGKKCGTYHINLEGETVTRFGIARVDLGEP